MPRYAESWPAWTDEIRVEAPPVSPHLASALAALRDLLTREPADDAEAYRLLQRVEDAARVAQLEHMSQGDEGADEEPPF